MLSQSQKAGRTKALRLRAEAGLADDAPVPCILSLAEERRGVSVLIFEHLDAELAGVYLDRGGVHLVVLNGDNPPVRLRFTLAHELCHHEFGDSTRADTIAGLTKPGHWMEVRANSFAGHLLLPEAAIHPWRERRKVDEADLYDVVALALEFGVSAQAAYFRLDGAGVPIEPGTQDAIRAGAHIPIAREGEPYPDAILEAHRNLPRIPERFRDSVFVKAALGHLTVAQAAARMGCSEATYRAAFGPLGLLPPA